MSKLAHSNQETMDEIETRAIKADQPDLRTKFVYPPIAIRTMDWCAYRDGTEEESGPYGWGTTEADAISDLLQQECDA